MHTLLVVEDNALNSKLAEAMLSEAGYNVITASDAEQMLLLMRTHQPDLVLMDIHLPGMDGVAALQLLRADPERRSTKAIAVTAMAMHGDRERMLAAGFDGYVAKPYRMSELLDVVRAALK